MIDSEIRYGYFMPDPTASQTALFAAALYEIRLLLGPRPHDVDPGVREASMLAYALHNEAAEVLRGNNVSVTKVLAQLKDEQRERLKCHIVAHELEHSLREGSEKLTLDDA